MEPTIPQPFLTPRQGELFTALYSHRLDILTLAAHEQLSYYELERFTAAIQPHLATLQSFLELTLPLRTLAARFATLTHLEEAAKTAQNPTEKRLAASALLRALALGGPPLRGGASPSSPSGGGAAVRRGGGGSVSTASTTSPSTNDAPCDCEAIEFSAPASPPIPLDPSLSRAFRAAAAAIRNNNPEPPPAPINHTATPDRTALPTRHSGLGTRHFSAAASLLSRAGQAPITTLEPLARPP